MYDLNFFAAPVKTAKKSVAGVVGALVLVLAIAAVAAFYFLMEWQAAAVRLDIGIMQDYLSSTAVTTQLAEMETIKQKSKLLNSYQSTFLLIDKYVKNSELISSNLLQSITATIPPSVTFKTFNLTRTEVLIDATAPESQPVAELLYNLKKTGLFTMVELLSVASDKNLGGEQVFTLRCVLKQAVIK